MIIRTNFIRGANVDKHEIFQLMNNRLDELEELLKVQADYLGKLREERDYFQAEHRIAMEKCAQLEAALSAAQSNHLPHFTYSWKTGRRAPLSLNQGGRGRRLPT